MKEYQARTADLKGVHCSFDCLFEAEEWLKYQKKNDFTTADDVIVLVERETEAEADVARLDWLERNGVNGLTFTNAACSGPITRAAIDSARNAPAPKVKRVEL